MAKKGKKKSADSEDLLNDDSMVLADDVSDQSDDVTYTMGDIKVADEDGSVEAEEFKKAGESLARDADIDGEDDAGYEDYNTKDEDVFLDMADEFDMDNPYGEED